MLHATIMAGGTGTRFWPASRKQIPKQLLKLTGDRTMLQSTVDRLDGIVPLDNLLIVTNQALIEPIRLQLPFLPEGSIIGEPAKRDTAPCVGLAARLISNSDPEAIMVVMPADHVIQNRERFREALLEAEHLVTEDPTRLVTFGIKPSYPADVFGYIERNQMAQLDGKFSSFQVRQFKEKPSVETARDYVASGNYYWNAGIFVWKVSTILTALRTFEPDMASHIDTIGDASNSSNFNAIFHTEFCKIKGKSIDYAVMERHGNVVVIEAPFDWDDVGNWTSLERLNRQDAQRNTVLGSAIPMDTRGSIIVGRDNHLIATIGLDDIIIVSTPDATLVAKKSDESAVKRIVELIESNGWQQYL